MNLLEKKSGQATLIIVMITLAAIVGVAATSSTQTSFNLRNTVYGVQSEQALACAEAGAEKLLGKYGDNDDAIPDGSFNLPGTLTGSECAYDAIITDYPNDTDPGIFSVPRVTENTVIQFKILETIDPTIDKVTLLNAPTGNTNGQLAVYVYDGSLAEPKVTRRMIHCGSNSAPTDFETASFSGDACDNIDLGVLNGGSILRIRSLNNDLKLDFSGFINGSGSSVPVGHYIESTGTAGTVERKVRVYRFYRQLPDFFDEAVAVLN